MLWFRQNLCEFMRVWTNDSCSFVNDCTLLLSLIYRNSKNCAHILTSNNHMDNDKYMYMSKTKKKKSMRKFSICVVVSSTFVADTGATSLTQGAAQGQKEKERLVSLIYFTVNNTSHLFYFVLIKLSYRQ